MSVDRVRAPYGFVPLSDRVVSPEWATAASQDRPFADGIDGVFTLRVEAVSPMHVRGTAGDQRSFRTPDGRFALPGSSLRGMVRNVVEIASFAKLSRVSDRRYALRDLHNREAYGQHMARFVDVDGRQQPVPIVNAGWLVPGDDEHPAVIHPCHFAKIEYALITDLAEQAYGVSGFNPGRKQSSVDKYARFERAKLVRSPVGLAIDRIARPVRDARLVSDYGRVRGPGDVKARLVFTGQPSDYVAGRIKARSAGNPKHHDFVFYGTTAEPIKVTRTQWEDFEFVHSATGQQNRMLGRLLPNREWEFWSAVFDGLAEGAKPHEGVPVFFLLEPGGGPLVLRAFGLAMMFRLAGRTSVREGVESRQPPVHTLDLAETLFGTVTDRRGSAIGDDEQRLGALAGRVSFGLARAVGAPTEGRPVRVVLGSPKASYYPSYLEQDIVRGPGSPPRRDSKDKPVYRTWNDAAVDATPRGWKRYRPFERHQLLTPPPPTRGDGTAIVDSKTLTTFVPLERGALFEAEVRLHNVRPVELGALLWALDFGGHPGATHKLGLGRSLGYGTVRLAPVGIAGLRTNDGRPVDPVACVEAYVAWMSDACASLPGGWAGSAQVRELTALAVPMPMDDARHMRIDHPVDGNEFQKAKLAGLVLRPAAEHTAYVAPATLGASRQATGAPSRARASSGRLPAAGLPAAGESVRVRLTERSKKGKWQAELVDGRGRGTFVQGDPFDGAESGHEHDAVVLRATSRFAIELRW